MCTQPYRAEPGVHTYTYHMDKIPKESWDNVVETLSKVEKIMSYSIPTNELWHLNLERELIGYKSMTPGNENKFLLPLKVFHTDDDVLQSVVRVHVDNHQYKFRQAVAYFCFPQIGIAVVLRPGNIIICNPQEPHVVSSRCCVNDKVSCVPMYLKTSVVGLNDNSIELTLMQQSLLENYC